jgi:hypothetical protein
MHFWDKTYRKYPHLYLKTSRFTQMYFASKRKRKKKTTISANIDGFPSVDKLQQHNSEAEHVVYGAKFVGCGVTRIKVPNSASGLTRQVESEKNSESEICQLRIPV